MGARAYSYYSTLGSSSDFIMFSTLFNFDVGETVKCQQITLINDVAPENTERFTVVLSRTPHLDPRIRISTQEAEVIITDSDGNLGSVLSELCCSWAVC